MNQTQPPTLDRSQFLLSRQALLDHLKSAENMLRPQISASKAADPYYQEQLIEKYATLQEDLDLLKKIASHSSEFQAAEAAQWDQQTILHELRQLITGFGQVINNLGLTASTHHA